MGDPTQECCDDNINVPSESQKAMTGGYMGENEIMIAVKSKSDWVFC